MVKVITGKKKLIHWIAFDDLYQFLLHTALENFILFARRDEIFRISLDVPELIDVRLPLANLTGASGLDWDSRSDKFFWTDVLQDTINSANSNVSCVLFVRISSISVFQ